MQILMSPHQVSLSNICGAGSLAAHPTGLGLCVCVPSAPDSICLPLGQRRVVTCASCQSLPLRTRKAGRAAFGGSPRPRQDQGMKLHSPPKGTSLLRPVGRLFSFPSSCAPARQLLITSGPGRRRRPRHLSKSLFVLSRASAQGRVWGGQEPEVGKWPGGRRWELPQGLQLAGLSSEERGLPCPVGAWSGSVFFHPISSSCACSPACNALSSTSSQQGLRAREVGKVATGPVGG